MTKAVHDFFEKLDKDPEFKKELQKVLELYSEENVLYDFSFDEQIRFIYEVIIPFAGKHGFDFNLEDIITEDSAQVTDEYLDRVAGGAGWKSRLSAGTLAALQMLTLMSPGEAFARTSGKSFESNLSSASKFEKENEEETSYGDVVDVLERTYKNLHPISEDYPLNEVDGMIFSTLVYLPMHCVPNLDSDLENKEITISEWAERLSKYYESSDEKLALHSEDEHNAPNYHPKILAENANHPMRRSRAKLFNILTKCPRYKDIKLGNFRGIYSPMGEETPEQMAAVTFTLDDGTKIVTFRGTDSTLAGWKEDLDLSWSKQVPAQRDALKYLEDIYNLNPNSNFVVTGHSKGGHLALYSSFYMCSKNDDFSKKLKSILNYDGPGFRKDIVSDMDSDVFDRASKKLTTFIPQSSIFGRIMNDTSKGKFVCIYSSSKEVFRQHDTLTWNIYDDYEASGAKFRSYEIQPESDFSADAISRFVDNIDKEQAMRICVNWIFTFMNQNNISMHDKRSTSEIFKEIFYNYFIKGKSLGEIIDTVFSPAQTIGISEKDKKSFEQVMGSAFKALAIAYWNKCSDAPDKKARGVLDLLVNKVFSLENIKKFIKTLYS